MKTNEEKRAAAKERRQQLSELSKALKAAAALTGEVLPVNELLKKHYDEQEGRTLELNTYEQWKAEGLQVKKGSVSFMIWGKPLKEQRTDKEEEKDGESDPMDDYFPVCHLFDRSQCFTPKTAKA
jgi:hypothetical protein